MKFRFDEQYRQYLDCIENYLNEQCFVNDEPQKALFEAMRYSLLAGGKRLRPIFVLDFCRMCGGDWKAAVPFAAAIEMIHTYSLIHDDLPCMDNDDYRRGKLTNHKVYGEAMAVLAGDALLTAAFAQLVKAPFDAETRIKAVGILANFAGELGMVGGQVLDMDSQQRECTYENVMDIQTRKTGALIIAACMLGVLAGRGTQQQLSAAHAFASELGMAFQIRDDMLDVIGNAEELGKAVGVDSEKNTLVQLYGIDYCTTMVNTLTEKAKAVLIKHFENTDFMNVLSDWLTNRTK